MRELWIAEAMDLLQEEVPVMTDEHAKDLADDLYEVCGTQPVRLAVMRFFCAMPGWPQADGVYTLEASNRTGQLQH